AHSERKVPILGKVLPVNQRSRKQDHNDRNDHTAHHFHVNVSLEKLKIQIQGSLSNRKDSGKRAACSISMVPVLVVSPISVSGVCSGAQDRHAALGLGSVIDAIVSFDFLFDEK